MRLTLVPSVPQYRRSGNFRVRNFRVLNFRVKIFS